MLTINQLSDMSTMNSSAPGLALCICIVTLLASARF